MYVQSPKFTPVQKIVHKHDCGARDILHSWKGVDFIAAELAQAGKTSHGYHINFIEKEP